MRKRFWMAAVVAGTLVVGNAPGLGLFTARNLDRRTRDEITLLSSPRRGELPAAPRDPSNRSKDSPAAIELGRRLFVDPCPSMPSTPLGPGGRQDARPFPNSNVHKAAVRRDAGDFEKAQRVQGFG